MQHKSSPKKMIDIKKPSYTIYFNVTKQGNGKKLCLKFDSMISRLNKHNKKEVNFCTLPREGRPVLQSSCFTENSVTNSSTKIQR